MHYVCSDIHGQYSMYLELLEKIDFSKEDHMYIVGDVIDRGPSSIPLLRDIIARPNMTLLCGNHEHMMLRAMKEGDMDDFADWMDNGGERTLKEFEQLSGNEQRSILQWLSERPLVIPNITVGEKTYYLAHASHTLYPEQETLRYCDAGRQNIEQVVWNRDYRKPDAKRLGYRFRSLYEMYRSTTLIIGHTPVVYCSYGIVTKEGFLRISRCRKGHLINLDCGAQGLCLLAVSASKTGQNSILMTHRCCIRSRERDKKTKEHQPATDISLPRSRPAPSRSRCSS